MASDALLVERIPVEDAGACLGLVMMNRPDELNPIDWDTGLALGRAFDELSADDSVRVVAVTGVGRAFSAGGDMKKYQQLQRIRRTSRSSWPTCTRSSAGSASSPSRSSRW